jgi:hypothetical protein
MNIEQVIEQHGRKIVSAAARAEVRKAVRKYYVYVWIRHNGDRVYVGKGCGPRAYREFEKGNVHLSAILRKDREAGFPDPQRILVAQDLTEAEAYDREMREIALHRRTKDGGTLTNMTDGGPGSANDEADIRRKLKAIEKYRRLYNANSSRPAVLDFEECRRQCNMNAKSGRGVVMKRLFEQPSTMQELCDHIKVMPPLGPYKGAQPADEDSVGKALRYIAARTKRVTKYRLVLSDADVYSISIQEDGL